MTLTQDGQLTEVGRALADDLRRYHRRMEQTPAMMLYYALVQYAGWEPARFFEQYEALIGVALVQEVDRFKQAQALLVKLANEQDRRNRAGEA